MTVKRNLITALTVLAWSSAPIDMSFGQTLWTAGTGNWNTAANWTLGVPNAGSPTAFDARIDNGGTAQLLGPPSGSVRRLRVGTSLGAGNLLVDAATLNVTEDLHLNEGSVGAASGTVRNGATVTSPSTIVGFSSNHNTNFLIAGSGTTFNAATQFIVANVGASTATLTVENAAVLTSGVASIGEGSGSTGVATVRGSGSRWSTTGFFDVGDFGTGTLTVENGGTVHVGTNLSINSISNVNLNGGTLRFNTIGGGGGLSRLNYTAGTIQLAGSRNLDTDATITTVFGASPTITAGKELVIEGTANLTQNFASFTVDGGRFSSASYFADAAVAGALVITNGGVVTTTGSATVGINNNNGGVANLSGPGSTWNVGDDLFLGPNSGGLSRIFVRDGAMLHVADRLQINNNGDIILEGGTIRFADIFNHSKIDWRFGTIQLAGNQFIADTGLASIFLEPGSKINVGKGLTIEGVATMLTTVTVDGGTFSAGQIVNPSLLDLQRGTFNLTNQAVTIGTGGLLGNTLDVKKDTTINVTLGITNEGLVTGDGQLGGTFANAAAGQLRAEPGRSLKLTGVNNTNAGQINLFGGQLEFTQNLTNNAGAFISGNGTLVTSALVNHGTMNFSGAANVVGDVTNSATGKVISSGGGPTTFYDDVVNNGEIRTSAGSFTVFYGGVTGSGTFTGSGTVNFEGDLKPGSSPASINFGGDVVFGPEATLVIELGGTAAGSQYDQINVAGELTLGGTLQISLINGFAPSAGQTFDILNLGSLAGAFSSIELPTLPGLSWNISQLAAGTLSVAIPGDFDLDGSVNAADFVVWQKGLVPSTPENYNLWRTNFGQTGGGSGAESSNASVPEPAGVVFSLVALSCFAFIPRLETRERSGL